MRFRLSPGWRAAIAASALASACLLGGPARAKDPTLALMHGVWKSEQRRLVIDSERMQANFDEKLPFQRESLVLHDVTGTMVVFSIGNRRFVGLFSERDLNLTSFGIAGNEVFQRVSR